MRELWVVLGTTMADRHPRTALRAVFARFDPSRTTGPNLASVLTTQRQKEICRGFYGSEGTRTRGLRRDRAGMRRSLSDPADPSLLERRSSQGTSVRSLVRGPCDP